MPAFATVLDPADLLAVLAYVDGLNGVTPPANLGTMRGPEPRKLAPEAQHGRELTAQAFIFTSLGSWHPL